MIKEVGNGYVVEYPYIWWPAEVGVRRGTLFTATFEGALKLLEENSMLPTPEKEEK